MLVVFPYSLKDQDQAVRLAEWIQELGPYPNHRALIVRDHRCDSAHDAQIERAIAHSFGSYDIKTVTDDAYDRWPDSANVMFRNAAKHIEFTSKNPFLWMEPDAIPLKEGWLDAIEEEYQQVGKPFMGDRVEVADVPLHMSGIGVYLGIMSAHAGLAYLAQDIAWDVAASQQIVPQAHFTSLIEHSWKRDAVTKEYLNVTFESWEQVEREISKEAVIYHASKDGSLIDRLRERKNLSGGEGGISEQDRQARQTEPLPRPEAENSALVTTDIFIKSYPPDYEWLKYCLRSIAKFATGFRRMIVIIPDEPDVIGFGLGMSNPDCRTIKIQESGEGYLFQQAVKASAHQYTDADYILHMDSDCILNRPITPETFTSNGKPLWMITPYNKIDVPWQGITEKFLGQPLEYEFMRRLPILIPRFLHEATAEFCLQKHGVTLTEYILRQPHRSFSEFNALGAIAYTRFHDQFEWFDTHAEEVAA